MFYLAYTEGKNYTTVSKGVGMARELPKLIITFFPSDHRLVTTNALDSLLRMVPVVGYHGESPDECGGVWGIQPYTLSLVLLLCSQCFRRQEIPKGIATYRELWTLFEERGVSLRLSLVPPKRPARSG